MNILTRFTNILSFIFVISIFPIFLNAECKFPNIDNCTVNEEDKVYLLDDENISIKGNSDLNVGSFILSKNNFNLDMNKSKLSLNRIIPANKDYKINIKLNDSTFIFRNSNTITIDKLTFNNSDNENWFTVQGFSNVTINNLEKENGLSALKIKSGVAIVNLKKASLDELYLSAGFLRIKEGESTINEIFNEDPKDKEEEKPDEEKPVEPENGYKDLNKGGRIEVMDKGVLTINKKVDISQLHIIDGTVNINGDYNIDLIDNYKSGSDEYEEDDKSRSTDDTITILNIGENSKGMVNTIRVQDLNLKGEMTIQNTGNITNLNYVKGEDGEYKGNAEGELTYDGKKIPDEEGKIDENDSTPSLTLKNTYLDKLIFNGGDITILSKDSVINTIDGSKNTDGIFKIDYVDKMQSTNVTLNKLELTSANYYVDGKFDVKNLKLVINSELKLKDGSNINFDSLEMGSFSKIEAENEGTLNINIAKNLKITGSVLELNNLTFNGNKEEKGNLTINIDSNLIKKDSKNNDLKTGVKAKGTIELTNVDIKAEIQDTSHFNLSMSHSYNVLQSQGGITWNDNKKENGKTNLPDWFDSKFYLSDDNKNLLVDVKRTKTYNQLLNGSNNKEDINTQNVAKSLDKMVEEQYFGTNGIDKVISKIDLKSTKNNIGSNLASLKPIDNNVYVHNIHSNATANLDMLSQNSSYSYLKTKNEESEILWVRNGFKKGDLKSRDYNSGNKYNSYFALAGFEIFAYDSGDSYFQLGVAGGFNFSDINAVGGKYDISSYGYDVALYSNFITDHFIFSLTSMYMNNHYSNDRYSISDSKATSNSSVSEVLTNIDIATKFSLIDNIAYDNAILKIVGINNLLVRPSIFYTNGYINGDKTVEKGSSGYSLGSYSTMIHDAGAGVLLYSTNDNVSVENTVLQGSYIPYLDFKTFYRTYSIPDTIIGFVDMGEDYDINIMGDNKDTLVVKTSLGVDYEKDAHILGLKYSYEHGFKNYADHGFYLNYKFLLN